MDITTDGFGFMLAVGDLLWVPFVYSLQARYLAFHPVTLGPVGTIFVTLLNATGYYIFRVANGEKDRGHRQRRHERIDVEQAENDEARVHGEHRELAMREIDHAHDAEDYGQPERHQSVDEAGENALYKDFTVEG